MCVFAGFPARILHRKVARGIITRPARNQSGADIGQPLKEADRCIVILLGRWKSGGGGTCLCVGEPG
jgi:hypothetical protein